MANRERVSLCTADPIGIAADQRIATKKSAIQPPQLTYSVDMPETNLTIIGQFIHSTTSRQLIVRPHCKDWIQLSNLYNHFNHVEPVLPHCRRGTCT